MVCWLVYAPRSGARGTRPVFRVFLQGADSINSSNFLHFQGPAAICSQFQDISCRVLVASFLDRRGTPDNRRAQGCHLCARGQHGDRTTVNLVLQIKSLDSTVESFSDNNPLPRLTATTTDCCCCCTTLLSLLVLIIYHHNNIIRTSSTTYQDFFQGT